MALNQSKVGTAYPAYRYEVAREKIREYAMALGESDARYQSDGDDCVAPPTFAAAFTLSRGLISSHSASVISPSSSSSGSTSKS